MASAPTAPEIAPTLNSLTETSKVNNHLSDFGLLTPYFLNPDFSLLTSNYSISPEESVPSVHFPRRLRFAPSGFVFS